MKAGCEARLRVLACCVPAAVSSSGPPPSRRSQEFKPHSAISGKPLTTVDSLFSPPRFFSSVAAESLQHTYTMRLVCFVAVSLGVVAAFIPSSVPSTTRASSAAGYRNDVLFAASSRGSARRATAAGVDDNSGSVGVIVCDHGSRRENANTMLFEVAERYRSFSGFDIVEVGFDAESRAAAVDYVIVCTCILLVSPDPIRCVWDIGNISCQAAMRNQGLFKSAFK